MAQNKTNKKSDTVLIWVKLPLRTNRKLVAFKESGGLKSKSVAIVQILNAFLFPVVNGDAA